MIADFITANPGRWPMLERVSATTEYVTSTKVEWVIDTLLPNGGGVWRDQDFNFMQIFRDPTPEGVLDKLEAALTDSKRQVILNNVAWPTSAMGSVYELLGRAPSADDDLTLCVLRGLEQFDPTDPTSFWLCEVTLRAIRVTSVTEPATGQSSKVLAQEETA